MIDPPHPPPVPATVQLRPRHDGWTPARQQIFLHTLADTGSVNLAARRAGMSRTAAYRLRRHPEAVDFRAMWDLALADALTQVPQAALERVLHGEEEEVMREGMIIAVRRRPAHVKLLLHMLERADAHRRRAEDQLAALREFRDVTETMPDSSTWVPSADAEHAARDEHYLPMTVRVVLPGDGALEIRQPRQSQPKIKSVQNQQ